MAAASKAQKSPQKCEDDRVKRFGSVLLGVAVLGSALACGPSFQAIYEGNSRFEHCYALDESPAGSLVILRSKATKDLPW